MVINRLNQFHKEQDFILDEYELLFGLDKYEELNDEFEAMEEEENEATILEENESDEYSSEDQGRKKHKKSEDSISISERSE